MLQSSAVGSHLDLEMPSGAQAGGHFQGNTAVLRPSEGQPPGPGQGGVPTGQHQPAHLPRCKRCSPPALLWPRPWALPAGHAHEQREKQEVLFPTESSFRPLLALSTALGFDARHPTLPGRRPTRPFPAGVKQAGNRGPRLRPSAASPRARPWGPCKEGASGSSGHLHPRGARSP